MILVKNSTDFKVDKVIPDTDGRFINIQSEIQSMQFMFFHNIEQIEQQLESLDLDLNANIVICGDFNASFSTDVDCSGGKPVVKESVNIIENIKLIYDLIDIWRIRNPDAKKYTW